MTNSTSLSDAEKYARQKELTKARVKKYRESSPKYKAISSVHAMIYAAKKRGDMARVEVLKERLEKIKSQKF